MWKELCDVALVVAGGVKSNGGIDLIVRGLSYCVKKTWNSIIRNCAVVRYWYSNNSSVRREEKNYPFVTGKERRGNLSLSPDIIP